MIKLVKKGIYRLVWTKDRQRMLYLGDCGYLWVYAKGIGELFAFSKHPHKPSYILAEGKYRIYTVEKEPKYVDLQHLELSVKPGVWQGYLLLTGLPTKNKIRSRIVPTDEIISFTRARKVGAKR
ncbi:MAG: hypothetical protein AAB783_01050 [Patescibacteria group bacterium]